MTRRNVRKLIAASLAGVPAILVGRAAMGQSVWTGTDSGIWSDPGNWTGGVPGSGNTAEFGASSALNGNVNLSGGTQAIGTILFDTTPISFNIGTTAGDTFIFDSGGAITLNSDVTTPQTISAAIDTTGSLNVTNNGGVNANSLTLGGNILITGGGALTVTATGTSSTTTLGGNISDSGGAGSLSLVATGTASGNDVNFIITGNNTYTGPTSINVNPGTLGAIEIGTDSAFGTSKVTVTAVTGASQSPNWEAFGGAHTISNAMDLNSGLIFAGTNALNFNGPINIISTNTGRTLNASTLGGIVTFGSTSSASTITLGNPVTNGGDGVGKTLTLNAVNSTATATLSMIVINDALQDAGPGGGTSAGKVTPQGGGTIRFNGQSTYSGLTDLSGGGTVIQIGSSSVMSGTGAISGPFGVGTLSPDNGTNSQLEAVGADQVVANPLVMITGMTVVDAPTNGINADPAGTAHNLTFSGPVTNNVVGKTTTNEAVGKTVFFGLATNPSTITLGGSGVANTAFYAVQSGATTVMNDVIQDSTNQAAAAFYTVEYETGNSSNGTFVIDAQNTYGGPTVIAGSGASNDGVIQIATSSIMSGASIVSGPFGRGTITINETGGFPWILQPVVADQVVANPITFTKGSFFGNASTAFNLTLSGNLTLNANGLTMTDNMPAGHSVTWGLATNPATFAMGADQVGIQTQVGVAGTGGGNITINDLITGSGTSRIIATGITLQLTNANNSFTGGITGTGGATVIVSADGDLGAASANVSLGNGTLLSTGSFPSARNILLSANGTNTIDVTGTNTVTLNGPLSGGVLTKGTNTGTLALGDASNTYASTVINGGTLSVSADGDLGNGGAVTLNGGAAGATLLSTGTFTSARTLNLTVNAVNTVDATAGNTLTLTSTFGGNGDLTMGTSGGTVELAQSGGLNFANNINVNGGTLALGSATSGGATGPLTVGGTLTINNGGKFAVLSSGATSFGMTNSVNSLQINGSGQLDLANSALITNTPYATVRQYLTNGYNSGAWNGTGGVSSSNAAADAAMGSNAVGKALGFVSGTSQAGMNLGLSSGQTMVKYTIYGDNNLDGIVNILDFGQFSANFGKSNVGWEEGDYNYDGVVNILDFGKLSANFGHSATATVAMGGASVNTTLTGAKASSSASTVKPAATPAGSGVSVVVNTTTGDVQLSFNNIQSRGYEIDSPSGEMNTFDQFDTPPGPAMLLSDGAIPANDNRGNKYWIVLSSDGDPTRLAEGLNTGYHFSTLPTINQTFDLGDIFVGPSGTNVPDLSVLYVDGLGNGFQQVVQYVGVPEPTTLGLMGLAAAGLLARRRKKNIN